MKTITETLAREFEARIASHVWEVGQVLPTEAQLAQEFSCSRGTISKAMERLNQLGLVERRTKVGTRVISAKRAGENEGQSLQLDACAIVFPNAQHELIWEVVQGFQQAAQEVGRRTVLLTSGMDFRKEAEIIGRLGEFDVKGAVLYPVIRTARDELYFSQMILSCPYPVVLADVSLPSLGRPSAVCDHFHGGFTLTNHFISKGLKRIGFLTDNSSNTGARERYLGFRVAMEQAGLHVPVEAVLLSPLLKVNFADPVAEGYSRARELLTTAPGLEAIVCCHDFLALGCAKAATEMQVNVSRRLKIGTIGAVEMVAKSACPLVTYAIDFKSLGREAFNLLQRCLMGENLGAEEVKLRGVIHDSETLADSTSIKS